MNIVLFEPSEIERPLPLRDERAEHVLRVLRRSVGESFDAGIIDGPKGKATVAGVNDESLELRFEWGEAEPPLYPIDLIVGLSRPQTNRKILQEATALGVRSMRFVVTKRGEPSYATSRLWSSGEWRRHLIAGAAQAFSTRLPEARWGIDLDEAVGELKKNIRKVALDNYEGTSRLHESLAGKWGSVALAVGSERGWTGEERECLRSHGFVLAHVGERVLRTETAVVAAVSQAVAFL